MTTISIKSDVYAFTTRAMYMHLQFKVCTENEQLVVHISVHCSICNLSLKYCSRSLSEYALQELVVLVLLYHVAKSGRHAYQPKLNTIVLHTQNRSIAM